jgi:hypothetical protein
MILLSGATFELKGRVFYLSLFWNPAKYTEFIG